MERSSELRVGVVGGSIAGCAMALAVSNAGADVTVFERSAGRLAERGFGIGMPKPLREQLVAAGYLAPATPVHAVAQRIWLTRAPDVTGVRELYRQPTPVVTCNWGLLWQGLRSRIPEVDYRTGVAVDRVRRTEDGGALVGAAGTEERFDLVIGADGYHSMIRRLVDPDSVLRPAGYTLWRASYPEALLPRPVPELEANIVTAVFPNGHAIFYFIPDAPAPNGHTGRKLNWAVYAYPPAELTADQHYLPGESAAPAHYIKGLAERELPARWARLVTATDDAAIAAHPVADLTVTRYAAGPFLLAGDAGALARPHTASGAMKAVEDALFLQRALREQPGLPEALAEYDRTRCDEGNRLALLGRRLGHDQVEATPDWLLMDPLSMQAWTTRTLAGLDHYLYRR
ncbi:NAD-binding protein [Nocardia sp. NPDC052566]|uniref:NAD-binding protein n=1 Tax=Nocardia sp. NPDC052566 TaxID=3364330 RepID=UPI0037CA93FD